MVLKLLKNIFTKKKKSIKSTPTASYQVQNDQASLEHNCTSESDMQSNETTTQNIDILDAKINHVTNAISLLEIEACEGTIPKWIQLLADFNAVHSHSKPFYLVFRELCQLNHDIRVTKFDNSVSNVAINQINFVTYGDNEANNSAFVIEYLVKLNEFFRGFKKRLDSFYGGIPSRIIDELLTAQPEMISLNQEFSPLTNSYSVSIKISYLIEYTGQSDTCQVDACNEAKLKAFGFLKQFISQPVVNLSNEIQSVNSRESSVSNSDASSSGDNDEIAIETADILFIRKLIQAIQFLNFGEQMIELIMNELYKKGIEVQLNVYTTKKTKYHVSTIRLKSSCLSFTEKSLISQNEAKTKVSMVFIQFLLNLKRVMKIFKTVSEFTNQIDSFELTTTLIEAVPELFEMHETPHYVIIEVKKLKSFYAKVSDENNSGLAQVEASKKLINFLSDLSNNGLLQNTNKPETCKSQFTEETNQICDPSQSFSLRVQERIRHRSELMKNFNQVNKKGKSFIDIINDLKAIDRTNKLSIGIQKISHMNFRCDVKIENIANFTATAQTDLESQEKAVQKAFYYLQNLSNLISHFKSVYNSDIPISELINELIAKYTKFFKIVHWKKRSFKTQIDFANIATFHCKAKSAEEAKMIAFNKLFDCLTMLSRINTNKTVASSIPPPPSHLDKTNLALPNSSKSQNPASNISKLNDEIFTSFSKRFKYEYNRNVPSLKILDILIATFPELIQMNSKGSSGHFKTSVTIKGVVTFSDENEFRRATKRNVAEKVVELLRQILFKQPSADCKVLKCENQIKTVKTTKIEQDDPAIVTSVSNLSSLNELFQCYRSECAYEKSEVELLDSLLEKCSTDIILKHSQSGPAHQPEHRFELSLVNANKTFTATANRKLGAKEKVAQKLVNYFRMCLRLEQMSLNRSVETENMNLDDRISKKIYEAVQKHWASVPKNFQKVKVLAAFVVTSDVDSNDVRVLSVGSGTKSINSDAISRDGKVVFDSHAEVIARRALVCLLYEHLEDVLQNKNNQQNVLERLNGGKFCLKRSLKLHLYISFSPCGATLKNFDDKLRVKMEALSGYYEMPVSYISNLGKIEDGKQKSTFMTCSDKIAMWNVVGLQGALLSHFIQPIYLDSLVVSDYFEYESCTRALYDRVDCTKLTVHFGKQSPEFRLNRHKVGYYRPKNHDQLFDFSLKKVFGDSYNWYRTLSDSSIIETINSRTGTVDNKTPSRLSKYSFAKRFKKLLVENCLTLGDNNQTKKRTKNRGTYWYLKEQATAYQNAKCALVSTFDETGLGVWINAYGGETDFFLVE